MLVSAPCAPGESRSDIIAGRTFSNYLWGDAATGSVPFNRQPNGVFLFSVAFHASTAVPTISSTIAGTVNVQVMISQPSCNTRVLNGTTISFVSLLSVPSVGPIRINGHLAWYDLDCTCRACFAAAIYRHFYVQSWIFGTFLCILCRMA